MVVFGREMQGEYTAYLNKLLEEASPSPHCTGDQVMSFFSSPNKADAWSLMGVVLPLGN